MLVKQAAAEESTDALEGILGAGEDRHPGGNSCCLGPRPGSSGVFRHHRFEGALALILLKIFGDAADRLGGPSRNPAKNNRGQLGLTPGTSITSATMLQQPAPAPEGEFAAEAGPEPAASEGW